MLTAGTRFTRYVTRRRNTEMAGPTNKDSAFRMTLDYPTARNIIDAHKNARRKLFHLPANSEPLSHGTKFKIRHAPLGHQRRLRRPDIAHQRKHIAVQIRLARHIIVEHAAFHPHTR